MQPYLVRRIGIAANAAELDAALTRLRAAEEGPQLEAVRWLHSYALREADGRFGLACIFLANEAAALRQHGERHRLAAAEVLPITRTLQALPFSPTQAVLVRRRGCWHEPAQDGDPAADLSRRARSAEADHGVTWLHSYVVDEGGGACGTWCLYRSASLQALLVHAASAGLPADPAVPVLGRILFRDEPVARHQPGLQGPAVLTPDWRSS